MAGAIYHITTDALGWLYPLLGIGGLALQCLAALVKSRLILILGVAITVTGAIPERDITLLAGSCLTAAGFWLLNNQRKIKK